jgi:hypothetical protein
VIRVVKSNQLYVFVIAFMMMVGCSEKSTTLDDLYLESWTSLEAYKHGKYTYIPANREITVSAKMEGNLFKVTAIGFVQNRKMALHLTYPTNCLSKKDTCLLGANKEFDALKKCIDKSTSGNPATNSCSVSSLFINGEIGSTVSDQLHAPHMDVWVKI